MQEFQNFVLRALYVFSSRERFLIGYIAIFLSGLLTSLFYYCASIASEPTASLLYLSPMFLAITPLVYAILLITRSHFYDLSNKRLDLFSSEAFYSVAMQAWIPSLAATAIFIVFWALIGLYHVIVIIPYIGSFINFIFGFIPFIMTSVLVFYSAAVPLFLFVIAPPLAMGYDLFSQLRRNHLAFVARSCVTYAATFPLAIFPFLFVAGVVWVTNHMMAYHAFSWLAYFFKMLIISTYMTPTLLFFCAIGLETYLTLIQKHQKEKEEEEV